VPAIGFAQFAVIVEPLTLKSSSGGEGRPL
jgi:hypothetical protein